METHDHREITPAVYAPVQRMINAGEWFLGRNRHAMGFLETYDWPTLSALKVTADCQWTFLQTLNRAKHRQLLNLRERAKTDSAVPSLLERKASGPWGFGFRGTSRLATLHRRIEKSGVV